MDGVKVPGDRWLNRWEITHVESRHIFHLKAREIKLEIGQVAPVVFHVLRACWKDGIELFLQAGSGTQQFPTINVPFLVGGALWSWPLNFEGSGHRSHMSRKIDKGKATGVLFWGTTEGRKASSSSKTPRRATSLSSLEPASSSVNGRLSAKMSPSGNWSPHLRDVAPSSDVTITVSPIRVRKSEARRTKSWQLEDDAAGAF